MDALWHYAYIIFLYVPCLWHYAYIIFLYMPCLLQLKILHYSDVGKYKWAWRSICWSPSFRLCLWMPLLSNSLLLWVLFPFGLCSAPHRRQQHLRAFLAESRVVMDSTTDPNQLWSQLACWRPGSTNLFTPKLKRQNHSTFKLHSQRYILNSNCILLTLSSRTAVCTAPKNSAESEWNWMGYPNVQRSDKLWDALIRNKYMCFSLLQVNWSICLQLMCGEHHTANACLLCHFTSMGNLMDL